MMPYIIPSFPILIGREDREHGDGGGLETNGQKDSPAWAPGRPLSNEDAEMERQRREAGRSGSSQNRRILGKK